MKALTHLCLCPILGTFLACLLSTNAAETEYAKHLREGIEEARQGNFTAATADLEAAVVLDPANSEGWYQLGLLHGLIADFTGAEAAFRRAIKLEPESAQAHYNLGLTLIANPRGKLDWPGAMAEFRLALKYKPDYPEALNFLGAGLTNTGEAQEAIPPLQHALLLKPSFAEAHFNLAIAFEKTERVEDAEKQYRATLALKSEYPEAATAFGKLLFRVAKDAEAEQVLTTAASLNPDMTDAHYTLARVLQALGKNKQAGIEFQIAKDLSERPGNAMQSSQLSNHALEFAAKGDLPGAIEMLRRAIVLKPDYGVPHYNRGLLLADTGDLAGAAQEIVKAISLLPGQSKPWLQLGRVFHQQGKNESALEMVSWAARMNPGDAAVQKELASLQSNSNSQPTGPATGSNRFTHSPRIGAVSDTAPQHLEFAEQLNSQNDFMGAAGELLRSLALQPAWLPPRRSLASTYERLADHDHARLEYYKILLVQPSDAETHTALGQIFLYQGDAQAAAEEFRIALSYQPDSTSAGLGLEKSLKALSNH